MIVIKLFYEKMPKKQNIYPELMINMFFLVIFDKEPGGSFYLKMLLQKSIKIAHYIGHHLGPLFQI